MPLALAGGALSVAAERASRFESFAVDEAQPAERAVLHGGTWDCAAVVPQEATLTVDRLVWVPYRGTTRIVLVGFDRLPACEGLAVPLGKLVRMQEPAYETLREHDTGQWASVPQASLLMLFPPATFEDWTPVLAIGFFGAGLAFLVFGDPRRVRRQRKVSG